MVRNAVYAGVATFGIGAFVTLALAAGFDVDLTQAMLRTLPVLLIGGVIVTFTALYAREELA